MVNMKFLKLELKNRIFCHKNEMQNLSFEIQLFTQGSFFLLSISCFFLYFCNIWLADSQQKKKLRILISFDLGYLDSYIVSGCQGEAQFFQNGKNTF